MCVEPGGLDPVLSRRTGIKSSTSRCCVTAWDRKWPRQDPQLGRGGSKHRQTHIHTYTTNLYEYNKDCTLSCCWKSKPLTTYLQRWVAVLLKVRCYIERYVTAFPAEKSNLSESACQITRLQLLSFGVKIVESIWPFNGVIFFISKLVGSKFYVHINVFFMHPRATQMNLCQRSSLMLRRELLSS